MTRAQTHVNTTATWPGWQLPTGSKLVLDPHGRFVWCPVKTLPHRIQLMLTHRQMAMAQNGLPQMLGVGFPCSTAFLSQRRAQLVFKKRHILDFIQNVWLTRRFQLFAPIRVAQNYQSPPCLLKTINHTNTRSHKSANSRQRPTDNRGPPQQQMITTTDDNQKQQQQQQQ